MVFMLLGRGQQLQYNTMHVDITHMSLFWWSLITSDESWLTVWSGYPTTVFNTRKILSEHHSCSKYSNKTKTENNTRRKVKLRNIKAWIHAYSIKVSRTIERLSQPINLLVLMKDGISKSPSSINGVRFLIRGFREKPPDTKTGTRRY